VGKQGLDCLFGQIGGQEEGVIVQAHIVRVALKTRVGLENPAEETTHHKVPLPGRIRGCIGNLRGREVHGKKLGHSRKGCFVLLRVVLMKHKEVCGGEAAAREFDRPTKNLESRMRDTSIVNDKVSRRGEIHNAQPHYL
jgi:hypothetical protein